MGSLTFGYLTLPSAHIQGDSRLPSVFPQKNIQTAKKRELDECDELFWDIGVIPNIMPYAMKSRYDRALDPTVFESATLENRYLKAIFLPQLGGKLWSLFDKVHNRELLYVNDCVRPCNLALCNAWTSGGVEWNIGMIGHSPFTCARMSTAEVDLPDGSKALRFYAFERVRKAVYQMDFILPDDSRVLLCRMRIKNLNHRTIPMYWFSNIAVPEAIGSRVIVPAKRAYVSDMNGIKKTAVPLNNHERDVTYAENSTAATDYFFDIDDRARKYIAYVDREGHGMFQTSTARQKGRKLFAWGTKQGGRNWQKWLTHTAGPYVEIQAGVNKTQYECIPMPPDCAWEWMEAYGSLSLDPIYAHGDYRQAQQAAEHSIALSIEETDLEEMIEKTRKYMTFHLGKLICLGEDAPWAALEQIRRKNMGERAFEPQLFFGGITKAQKPWLSLLNKKGFHAPDVNDFTFQIGDEWKDALSKAKGWYAAYHLGLNHWYDGDEKEAIRMLLKSWKMQPHAQTAYAISVLYYMRNDPRMTDMLLYAEKDMRGWVEFGREAMQMLCDRGLYQEALLLNQRLEPSVRKDGHVIYFQAVAFAHCGRLEEAEQLLIQDGTLMIYDLREGVTPLSDLWSDIQKQQSDENHLSKRIEEDAIPPLLDYRMV